jgi:hypothetical protein
LAGGNHGRQIELRPAVASLAIGRELMVVPVQAGEGAEVDHGARAALTLAQGVSLVTD